MSNLCPKFQNANSLCMRGLEYFCPNTCPKFYCIKTIKHFYI